MRTERSFSSRQYFSAKTIWGIKHTNSFEENLFNRETTCELTTGEENGSGSSSRESYG
jgi:hypothetical protein